MDGQRKALIVAADIYDDSGLRQLTAPTADASALARVLSDPEVGAFSVQVIHNQPSHIVQEEIEVLFADAKRDDVLLLHFSCHGIKSESGDLYFAARNTHPTRLATAVPAEFVQRCMRSSRCRNIILFLDCCYGGAFSRGVTVRSSRQVNVLDSFPSEEVRRGHTRAVITASSAMEYAFEGEELAESRDPRPSVFTSALVEGLATGAADRNEDGWITLDDVYDYVFEKVQEINPHQTPSRDIEGQGEVYIARSRRRRLRADSLPAELQAAIADTNMFSRTGAVSELQARISSTDLPTAFAAVLALRRIADTDIKYVADIARSALLDASLHVEPAALDFGQLARSSAASTHFIAVAGPPIARVYTVEPPPAWLRVTEQPEGLLVAIDTVSPGAFHHFLSLTGPAGDVHIPVAAVVLPPVAKLPLVAEPSGASPAATKPTPPIPDADVPTAAPGAGHPAPPYRTSRRRAGTRSRAVWLLVAVVIAVVVAIIGLYASTSSKGPSTPQAARVSTSTSGSPSEARSPSTAKSAASVPPPVRPDLAAGAHAVASDPIPLVSGAPDAPKWVASHLTDGVTVSSNDNPGFSSEEQYNAVPNPPEIVRVDLGADHVIGSLQLFPRTAVATEPSNITGVGFPADFAIETSTDDENWVQVLHETGQSADDGLPRTYTLPADTHGEFVRLTVTRLGRADSRPANIGDNGWHRLQLTELKAYA